jgi:hypothetical protein
MTRCNDRNARMTRGPEWKLDSMLREILIEEIG